MSSISSLSSTDPLLALLQSSSTSSNIPAASASSTASPLTDTAEISGPGQLFTLLRQLQQTDPEKFKQVTSQIASQLQSAAQEQGSTGGTDFLSQLADKFQQASQTGDASSLQGPQASGHHHRHGTYNRAGQSVPAADPTTSSPVQQLLSTISTDVSNALGALTAAH